MSAYPNPISPVYSSKFCHLAKHEHLLISGNEDGKIILFDTNKPLRSASKDSICKFAYIKHVKTLAKYLSLEY